MHRQKLISARLICAPLPCDGKTAYRARETEGVRELRVGRGKKEEGFDLHGLNFDSEPIHGLIDSSPRPRHLRREMFILFFFPPVSHSLIMHILRGEEKKGGYE